MDKQNFLGTYECVRSFFYRPEKELSLMQLGYHDFHGIRPHKFQKIQDYYTVHFVVSGKGRLELNDHVYELKQGDIFAVPPGLYMYYPLDEDPWDYIFLVFDGSLAETYLQPVGFSLDNPVRSCNNYRKLLAQFAGFFEKAKHSLPTSYLEAVSLFFATLHSALDSNSEMLRSENNDIIEEAKSLIQLKFYDSDLTVEQIADSLHFSHSQLCRLFKEKTGTTMIAYINDTRMKYAEELFRTTALKATEIAYMSGFNEYTYFLMQFKRRNHMTTSQYRNLHKKK